MERVDAVIGGGGAGGLSCALFLARAGVRVAVFDDGASSLRRVSVVYNYLGFPDGVGGGELLDLGAVQARRFGAEFIPERLERVTRDGDVFVTSTATRELTAAYFVIASNKRTDLATALGLQLGGFGGRFVETSADGATAVDRCYATGRITGMPSQAIVSAGHGAQVAIAIIQRMRGEYYVDHDT